MTFIRILKCDIIAGILTKWNKYLTTFVIFLAFSLFLFLERNVVEYVNPAVLQGPATLGDYLFYIIAGSDSFDLKSLGIASGTLDFELPTSWIIYFLWLLYITLYYPYDDLAGHGKHMLALSKNRTYWWLSKCCWAILSVLTYFATALAAVVFFSLISGASMTLEISNYLPYNMITDHEHMYPGPWDIRSLLFLTVLVGIAICMLQLLLSLVVKPLQGYVIMCVYIFCCSYFNAPALVGNFSMASRSIVFVSTGMKMQNQVIICFWIISACLLMGNILFNKMDVLNKE